MQYNRRNNIEIGILNELPGEDRENNVIEITLSLCCIQRSQLAGKVKSIIIVYYDLITIIFLENPKICKGKAKSVKF